MAKPSWITLNKSSGTGNDTIDVTAQINPLIPRDGMLVVVDSTDSIRKSVNISQEGMMTNSLVKGIVSEMSTQEPPIGNTNYLYVPKNVEPYINFDPFVGKVAPGGNIHIVFNVTFDELRQAESFQENWIPNSLVVAQQKIPGGELTPVAYLYNGITGTMQRPAGIPSRFTAIAKYKSKGTTGTYNLNYVELNLTAARPEDEASYILCMCMNNNGDISDPRGYITLGTSIQVTTGGDITPGDNGDASVIISMGDGTFTGDTLCEPGARIGIEAQIAGENITKYAYCGLLKASVGGGLPVNLAYGGINTNESQVNPSYGTRLSVGIDNYSKRVSFIINDSRVEDSGEYYIMLFNGSFSSPTDAIFSSGCPITVSV